MSPGFSADRLAGTGFAAEWAAMGPSTRLLTGGASRQLTARATSYGPFWGWGTHATEPVLAGCQMLSAHGLNAECGVQPAAVLHLKDPHKKSGPISGTAVQRGRKAGSQGRLCKMSLWQAERLFGSCRELWVVVKVILLVAASFVVLELCNCRAKAIRHKGLW